MNITMKKYCHINMQDFQLGSIVQFNVYKFQLMRGDEFTVNYMKQKPESFKEADIAQIIAKLRLFADGYPNFDTFLLDTMKYNLL